MILLQCTLAILVFVGTHFQRFVLENSQYKKIPSNGIKMTDSNGILVFVGVWIIFVGFLFKKTWRFTNFNLFDKFYDKVQIFFVVTWQQWFKKTNTN